MRKRTIAGIDDTSPAMFHHEEKDTDSGSTGV